MSEQTPSRQTLVEYQKGEIKAELDPWLGAIAEAVRGVWPDPDGIDRVLAEALPGQPKCRLLYLIDPEGRQISSNVSPEGIDPSFRGQTLADRPYFRATLPYRGLTLSPVYVSRRHHNLVITALYPLHVDDCLQGFIAADFFVDDLELTPRQPRESTVWKQFRGDRAIRGTLFLQERITSRLDEHHDEVNALLTSLMQRRGVFHVLVHFSSARAVIWLYDDPYRYQLLGPDELTDPATALIYGRSAYPAEAVVAPEAIPRVLERFKALRNADENIYLRSGSLNLINGLVGLTFSCDGSHYMSAGEFLERDLGFWFGRNPED